MVMPPQKLRKVVRIKIISVKITCGAAGDTIDTCGWINGIKHNDIPIFSC